MRNFSQKVYQVVKRIPSGKVMSYGQIASFLGKPRAARVIGNALHKNSDPRNIPCHRVVSKDGRLAKRYAFGGARGQKRRLLKEGMELKDRIHVDLNKCKYQISKIKITD